MEPHGIPWNLMESHGTSWNPMEFYRTSWNLTESHRISWKVLEHGRIFWLLTNDYKWWHHPMYLQHSRSQQSVYKGSLLFHSDIFSSNSSCSTLPSSYLWPGSLHSISWMKLRISASVTVSHCLLRICLRWRLVSSCGSWSSDRKKIYFFVCCFNNN
jgi:hypothetical protein